MGPIPKVSTLISLYLFRLQNLINAVSQNLLSIKQKSPAYWVKIMTGIGVPEDETTVNFSIEALQYLILHLAKTNADNQNFEMIFASSGIKEEFTENFKAAVMPKLSDLRDLLNVENE